MPSFRHLVVHRYPAFGPMKKKLFITPSLPKYKITFPNLIILRMLVKLVINTKTKSYPTTLGQLHGSYDVIVLYLFFIENVIVSNQFFGILFTNRSHSVNSLSVRLCLPLPPPHPDRLRGRLRPLHCR